MSCLLNFVFGSLRPSSLDLRSIGADTIKTVIESGSAIGVKIDLWRGVPQVEAAVFTCAATHRGIRAIKTPLLAT